MRLSQSYHTELYVWSIFDHVWRFSTPQGHIRSLFGCIIYATVLIYKDILLIAIHPLADKLSIEERWQFESYQ